MAGMEELLSEDEAWREATQQQYVARHLTGDPEPQIDSYQYKLAARVMGIMPEAADILQAIEPTTAEAGKDAYCFDEMGTCWGSDRPLQPDTRLLSISFRQDKKGPAAEVSFRPPNNPRRPDGAVIVPARQTGWQPQPNVPYEVALVKRIDTSERVGFKGVWTCRPIDATGDELRQRLRSHYNQLQTVIQQEGGKLASERSAKVQSIIEQMHEEIIVEATAVSDEDKATMERAAESRQRLNEVQHWLHKLPKLEWSELNVEREENTTAYFRRSRGYGPAELTKYGSRDAHWVGFDGHYDSAIVYRLRTYSYPSPDEMGTRSSSYLERYQTNDTYVSGTDVVAIRKRLVNKLARRAESLERELTKVVPLERAISNQFAIQLLERRGIRQDNDLAASLIPYVGNIFKSLFSQETEFDPETVQATLVRMASDELAELEKQQAERQHKQTEPKSTAMPPPDSSIASHGAPPSAEAGQVAAAKPAIEVSAEQLRALQDRFNNRK